MSPNRVFVFGVVLALSSAAGFSQQKPSDFAQRFVIDHSKPYAYIKFDHTGARKPVNEWESPRGLWLRLVNNCRIPLQLSVLGSSTGDPGVLLKFEVVEKLMLITGPDIDMSQKAPPGYFADIGTLVTIQPGKDLLFSVPAETVTNRWYIETRFEFELPDAKLGVQPSSVVEFTWDDIPEHLRTSTRTVN
jgi:hypothetical protein